MSDENEIYQQILAKVREKDSRIDDLEKKVKKLTEVLDERKKENPIVGYCSACGAEITAEDAKAEGCPKCGNKTYNTYPR